MANRAEWIQVGICDKNYSNKINTALNVSIFSSQIHRKKKEKETDKANTL